MCAARRTARIVASTLGASATDDTAWRCDMHANREREITDAQRYLRPLPTSPRTSHDYRKIARWWKLEAERSYESALASLRYSQNMRWAAELAGPYGPGLWLELIQREGVKNPETETRSRRLRT